MQTPLEFLDELYTITYALLDELKNARFRSAAPVELLILVSHNIIISVFKSTIAFTFFICFGQLVDMLRELQFCILIVSEHSRLVKMLTPAWPT